MAVIASLLHFYAQHGTPVLGAVAIVACTVLLRFIISYTQARRQFPGPPVYNIFKGNLDETMANDVHEKWIQWNREYGHVFQTWNGLFSRVIYIGDPRMIAEIATTNWPKSEAQYEGFRPLDGDALFVQTNQERWKMQSKRLAPAFQPSVIQSQYGALAKHIRNYVRQLDNAIARGDGDGAVDLSELNILLSIDFIGDIAFGRDFNAINEGRNCRISQLLEMILPELMKCGLFPLRGKIPIRRKTRVMNKAITELRNLAYDAVKDARRDDGADNGKVKPDKKIFEILALQKEADGNYTFNSQELCDNYVAFLVAGGDPTAHTMSFLIWQALKQPAIYEQLRAEVDAQIPFDVEVATIEHTKLPYLNMVLKETLRFSSPGFGTFRTCSKDTTVAGVTLPANTTIALWNPAVHRDPRLWENPDKFDPERWRSGQQKVRGSYFPFSYGPRSCTGQGLAMLEMSLTLATLLRRYDISLEPGFELEYLPSFTLKPKNGLRVRVRRREN
ncbi:cytochrome P450 46A1 [Xylaria sp. CBS 124048]|nr:cytochrome P450 46A1 [Xylaria sp. CBS 124048]